MKCKICGHEIFQFGKQWFHESGKGLICESLVVKRIWGFFRKETICACSNPEPLEKKEAKE